jgi:PsbN protein
MEAAGIHLPPARTPTQSPPPPATLTLMNPSSTGSPALSVAITVLAVLLGLTGLGIYLAFGPPSKGLTDPFDDHDD